MTTQKDGHKAPAKQYDDLVQAIAKANGHPDPEAFLAEVNKHLEGK